MMKPIYFLLLGFNSNKDWPLQLEKEVEQFYQVQVSSIKTVQAVPFYFEPKRNRYKADKLLSYYQDVYENKHPFILTSKDIAISKKKEYDWGILGYSIVGKQVAVVSNYRIHTKSLLTKVVLHEFGHSIGLPHCSSKDFCLMKDAHGKGRTIEKQGKRLCDTCQKKWHIIRVKESKLFGIF